MIRISLRPVVLLLAASGVILAQQPPVDPQTAPASNAGWRRAGDAPPAVAQDQQDQSVPVVPQDQPVSRDAYGQAQPSANRPPAAQPPRPAYGLPAEVVLKPGTFVTMRINQRLASNKNSVGDTFSGALSQPLVVNGILVAQRGQMAYGRVVEAQKLKGGMNRLGIELTSIALVDGSQVAIHTQLMSRQGPPMPYGREEGAITTATADGTVAAPGAPTIGVLATKGHASEIYPQTTLTFQTSGAVSINTSNSSGAFRYVGPDDYSRPASMTTNIATRPAYAYGAGYPYPYPYPYYGYPYYWGPSFGFGIGFGGWGWRGGWRR
jgi:hypothetical protein